MNLCLTAETCLFLLAMTVEICGPFILVVYFQCVKLMQKVSYGFKIATNEPYIDELVTYLIKQM